MTKSDLVRKFIIDNPKIRKKRSIAQELFKQDPKLWKSLNNARDLVTYVTGSHGEKLRNDIKNPEHVKFFYNGFEQWAEENLNTELAPWDEPFIIPKSIKQLNIIADLHSVHMDPKVMQRFLKETKDKEAVLLNGDLMDSESLSRHLKGHNVIEYEKEIEICHQILKGLTEEFNHVYFKAGNHDFWLERYLLTNAREVFRLLGLDLPTLLRCGELGVHHIHNLRYWNYGDLDGVHAHEFPGFGMGKFPATGLLDKWQTFKGKYDVKIIGSHCHRYDHTISKKSKDGKFGEAWITPAMCRKSAGFNPYAGWNQGWAVAKCIDGVTEVKVITT